jgi:hypothetical protein
LIFLIVQCSDKRKRTYKKYGDDETTAENNYSFGNQDPNHEGFMDNIINQFDRETGLDEKHFSTFHDMKAKNLKLLFQNVVSEHTKIYPEAVATGNFMLQLPFSGSEDFREDTTLKYKILFYQNEIYPEVVVTLGQLENFHYEFGVLADKYNKGFLPSRWGYFGNLKLFLFLTNSENKIKIECFDILQKKTTLLIVPFHYMKIKKFGKSILEFEHQILETLTII